MGVCAAGLTFVAVLRDWPGDRHYG
jgi:hypothetical protein